MVDIWDAAVIRIVVRHNTTTKLGNKWVFVAIGLELKGYVTHHDTGAYHRRGL